MADNFKVALLTGNGLRHRYVAQTLAGAVNLVGVVYEQKAKIIAEEEKLSPDDQRDIRKHMGERDAVERRLLGEVSAPQGSQSLPVEHGGSNASEVFDWVRSLDVDFIVLYGSSIIKPPLLDVYGERMVNIHLGLSPYYRGSGTNFWPLVYREPECVGATLHLAVSKVDAGPILAQVRPEPAADDRAHELGTKTIMAAAALMPRVLAGLASGRLTPSSQDLKQGRLCRRRDFNAESVRTMWHHFKTGMMSEYLADAEARRAKFPLVELKDSER